jgi:hypothetical protein
MAEEKARLLLNIFDGARRPIDSDINVLVTLREGNQKEVYRKHQHGPSLAFNVLFYNNFGDNYAAIVWAKHYQQAGFHPIHVRKDVAQTLDLMPLPKSTRFDFSAATWGALGDSHSALQRLLGAGSANTSEAEDRYNGWMD